MTDLQVAHIKRELSIVERTTEYVRNLVDGELTKLEHKTAQTAKDAPIIADLMKAAHGETDGPTR